MPKLLKCLFAIAIISLLYSSSAKCLDVEILVDISDSMRGFFATGSLQNSVNEILSCAQEANLTAEAKIFRSNINDKDIGLSEYGAFLDTLGREGVKSNLFGTNTLLDRAYEHGKETAKVLFIVTDNIHQEHEVDTKNFYQKFKDQEIKYIYIIPEILDFDGPIFFDKGDFPDYMKFKNKLKQSKFNGRLLPTGSKVGTNSIIELYKGERGIMIYAILLDTELEKKYFETLVNLKKYKRDALIVKPIDGRYIKINPVKDQNLAIKMLEGYFKRKPTELEFARQLPNMTLQENKNILTPLQNAFPPVFRLDEANIIRFWFAPESKLPYVNIGKADNLESSPIELSISDISLRLNNKAIGKHVRFSQAPSGKVVPSVFLGSLPAASNTNIPSSNNYCYITEIKFGPLRINWNFGSFFNFLRYRSIPASLSFNIRLIVPPHQISLSDDFKDRYFTNDMTKLDRIYTPVDLFTYLSEEPLTINIGVVME